MAASSSSVSLFGFRETDQNQNQMNQQHSSSATPPAPPQKKKRNQPGTPNPDAEVIALSPKTLMATNRFICEVCNKGFQREQNLQLHRRGHNLPWKLKQKTTKDARRKVYLCPEPTCIHHDPSRALGDLTGIKKHYYRKHGEKKWKCDKCSKKYAVQSDWKAHSKICGTREYRCDCGTIFSRRDSFITHRAFCDALAQESERQPPNLSSANHLYGTNHSNMALALSQVAPQMSNIQDQINNNQSTDLLHHGDNIGPIEQFNHHSSLHDGSSSFKPLHQTMQHSPPSFFMDADNLNQNYNHPDQSRQQQQQQGLVQQNKVPFQGLMHLSHDGFNNHHNNSPSPDAGSHNLFNHLFLSTNNSNNSFSELFNSANGSIGGGNEATNFFTTGNSTMGGHHHQQIITSSAPSLFSTSLQSNNSVGNTHHMSATALLQKVAQMSATSSNSTTSLLKNFGSITSSSSIFGGIENNNSNMQDLMNTFAASGNTSILEDGGSLGLTGFEPYDDKSNRRKEPRVHGVNIGGSDDRLTRDFLGVGEIVRSMNGGREQHGHGGSGGNLH
ncbi:PREDICTED: protein indeterminate-domain 5, chloroplastic-like isoform X2 [Lupinus angustifolius]|uniref:protein indeterminate-domain 5, chloroplastic-like isoform X2 n=1 Tax=Lupinus angustifolius TaxID=3871 RepID=UPI00092EB02E|nr:PREDICTED: protein indeterminate-domain 5, chloroplastic-like isoform X2 [Lupinus angustifolius]